MSEFEAKFERIKNATGLNTQVDLAEFFGIRQSSISDAKKRDSIPSGWYLSLIRKLSINPEWIDTGFGAKYLAPSAALNEGSAHLHEPQAVYGGQEAPQYVPVYSMSGEAAHDGSWNKVVVQQLCISPEFNIPSLMVVKMEGTSMEPFLRAGAYVGLDTEKRSVLSGEVYAVQIPFGGLVLRRVYLNAESEKIILKADNAGYADQELSFQNHQGNIIGRLAWVMQAV